MTAEPVSLGELCGQVRDDLAHPFRLIDAAESEIELAQLRHPDQAGRLWHTFRLLPPVHGDLIKLAEFVYRGHARELLERVAAGEDTRPGTAVEALMVLREASLVAPMNTTGTGLYLRMWRVAFPDREPLTGQGTHYEAIRGSDIDDAEQMVRRKLSVPARVLGDIECDGIHHSQPADCPFVPAAVGALF